MPWRKLALPGFQASNRVHSTFSSFFCQSTRSPRLLLDTDKNKLFAGYLIDCLSIEFQNWYSSSVISSLFRFVYVSNDLTKHIHESVQKDDDVLITLSIDLVGNHISQVCRWLRYPASRTKAPLFLF